MPDFSNYCSWRDVGSPGSVSFMSPRIISNRATANIGTKPATPSIATVSVISAIAPMIDSSDNILASYNAQ